MRVVECSGTPTEMGEATGEALREEIGEHLAAYPMRNWEEWEHRARVVAPANGIPQMTFTFCGMIATTDGMNAEGVAVGHSSVGSVFQQSDRHVPIRLQAYDAIRSTR